MRRPKTTIAMVVLAVLLVGALLFIGPRNLRGYWKYGGQARQGSLTVGQLAPDVSLIELDGATRSLSDWQQGKPLVLVFGSFT